MIHATCYLFLLSDHIIKQIYNYTQPLLLIWSDRLLIGQRVTAESCEKFTFKAWSVEHNEPFALGISRVQLDHTCDMFQQWTRAQIQ